MVARAAVQKLLEDDTVLADIGVTSVYAANSVDTPPDKLFVVVKWGIAVAAFSTNATTGLQIWVYDVQRDYGRITEVLKRLSDILPSQVHLLGEDGWTLSQAAYLGESDDLFDSGYNAVTRYADFTANSRYTPS